MKETAPHPPFWEKLWLWIAISIISVVPFLFIIFLPFNDLPNHIGRYYVFLNLDHDLFLQKFYGVHWSIIGNLGVDLLVRAIGPWLGADLATHVVVALIPPLTIGGIYSLSKAMNGRIMPGALAATPLAFNWPLITGFVNFCLSAALALLVLAGWIRLRGLSFRARFVIFLPLAFLVWLAHTAGWGLLGLGVLAYELGMASEGRAQWDRALLAPLQTAPFAMMAIPILAWRSTTATGSGIGFGHAFLFGKLLALVSLMREHFEVWDLASTVIFAGLIGLSWLGGRKLIWPATVIAVAFLLAFILCPPTLFQSAFADRRLLTYAALMVPLAIGIAPGRLDHPASRRYITAAAIGSIAFFCARVGVTTVVWAHASSLEQQQLALIDSVPLHSRIFGLVVEDCRENWNRVGRPDHLQQYALVRRDSMINGMFHNSGLNQVIARFDKETGFNPNMYAVVRDQRCPVSYIGDTLQSAMVKLPRNQFDYVWIIGEQPLGKFDTSRLVQVGAHGNDRLYKITAQSDPKLAFRGVGTGPLPA